MLTKIPYVHYALVSRRSFCVHLNHHLEPRVNFVSNICQSILGELLLGNSALSLCLGKSSGLSRGVVSEASFSPNFCVSKTFHCFSIGAFVDGDNRCTPKAEILLKGIFDLSILDQSVVCPAPQMPDQFSALGKASCPLNRLSAWANCRTMTRKSYRGDGPSRSSHLMD